jgi:hypothetical protein
MTSGSPAGARPVPTMRSVADRPARTLADALAAAAARAGADDDVEPTVERLRATLDRAAHDVAARGGWTADDPLRLSKAVVTWLLRCPRRALAAGDAGMTDDLVAGLVIDAAAKLATLAPQHRPTVDGALAYLRAGGDTAVDVHLADRGDRGAALLADLAGRVDTLAAVWPTIDPGWWPRFEEPVRARLAGGAVMVGGRLDVLLGGPPTGRPAVVVEVKGGRWHDGVRADGHLYALLVALRDGRAPHAVVTVVADGTTQVEPVRPAVLETAADRIEQALEVAASIAAGEPPAEVPGPHCPHCPVLADCAAGRAAPVELVAAG